MNNAVRTCIEAIAATQGHTQSLHTNAFDEALALPTDVSARIARNTQLLLQQESGTTAFIDPWGGSFTVERLTHDLAERARAHITEIEALGGMAKAIEAGIPKLRIEEAAARTQARIDSGRQVVVGVNRYRREDEPPVDVLKVDNAAVRARQIEKLARLRSERDEAATGPRCPRSKPARAAAATCSNSPSPRRAPRRPSARFRSRWNASSVGTRPRSGRARRLRPRGRRARRAGGGRQGMVKAFTEADGRKPRIMVAKVGQDGHDRGQKVIASAFADLGFEVDIGPLFQTPEEAADQAAGGNVHVIASPRSRPGI